MAVIRKLRKKWKCRYLVRRIKNIAKYYGVPDLAVTEEELEEQIIQQIEVLVDELGGTMCHLTKCDYTGRQSKVIEIEYRVEES